MKTINYKYELDKKKNRKHRCPECQKDKVFTRYIHKQTGHEAGELFGVCSRKESCRYRKYPNSLNDSAIDFVFDINKQLKKKELKFLSKSEYKAKLYRDFDTNYLIDFMYNHLGVQNTDMIINDYKLGTGKNGSCLFPYFDHLNNLVTYKTVFYKRNGKRRHDLEYNALLDNNRDKHPIPLFGIHLINKYKDLPIGIVEGEKTAALMRYYNPYILWLAAGSSTWLNPSKLYPIRGRTIYLFPDVGQYENWYNIMQKIKDRYPTIDIDISREPELLHSQLLIDKGDDIADYYLKAYKWSHERQKIERQEIKPIK